MPERALKACEKQLHQETTQVASVREQNQELASELAWALRDLLRLRLACNETKCVQWLQGAAGLSSVRCMPDVGGDASVPPARPQQGDASSQDSTTGAAFQTVHGISIGTTDVHHSLVFVCWLLRSQQSSGFGDAFDECSQDSTAVARLGWKQAQHLNTVLVQVQMLV